MDKIIFPIIQGSGSSPPKSAHIHPSEIVKDIGWKDIAGTKILFINMPLRETAVPNTTPEGPLLMMTNLRDNFGVIPTIIDFNCYRIKDELANRRGLKNGRHKTEEECYRHVQDHIAYHGEPDVVAMSGKITTLKWQQKIAKMVRTIMPKVFIVSGNGLATELKIGLFNYIPELDAIGRSEGDDVIIKICYDAKLIRQVGLTNAINSGRLAPYYMGEINGKHRFDYAGDRPNDLDKLPFADLEFLREDVYGVKVLDYYLGNEAWGLSANNSSAAPFITAPKTTSVSSRGCPYGCKYCYRGAQGERKWGIRSAEHLYKEILAHLEKYQIKFKSFPDDNFAVTEQRIADLVPLLGPLGIPWGTHTRLDEAAGLKPKPGKPGQFIYESPLRINNMAKAGCKYIGFGPESAHPTTLEALGKGGFTLQNGYVPTRVNGKVYDFPRSMIDGIRNCQEAGIHANCTWIKGNPTETLENLKQTVAFIMWQTDFYAQYRIPADSVNKRMFTLTWYPGTEIIRYPKVRRELKRIFGLNFDPETHEPVCDEHFLNYCLALDDATKVLEGPSGEPLNFSEMPNSAFLKVRELVDSGQTFKILDL